MNYETISIIGIIVGAAEVFKLALYGLNKWFKWTDETILSNLMPFFTLIIAITFMYYSNNEMIYSGLFYGLSALGLYKVIEPVKIDSALKTVVFGKKR